MLHTYPALSPNTTPDSLQQYHNSSLGTLSCPFRDPQAHIAALYAPLSLFLHEHPQCKYCIRSASTWHETSSQICHFFVTLSSTTLSKSMILHHYFSIITITLHITLILSEWQQYAFLPVFSNPFTLQDPIKQLHEPRSHVTQTLPCLDIVWTNWRSIFHSAHCRSHFFITDLGRTSSLNLFVASILSLPLSHFFLCTFLKYSVENTLLISQNISFSSSINPPTTCLSHPSLTV